ncbi:hypothetical protein CRG98_025812 [Punica granatum]|uniref:chitinase n=1 Tax=Punica granatum TaxID=22663 RepID=A0A2I0JDS0_PUNGR|nr:hypothetical protein CRG98_025812 [Punica granatum]
MATNTPLFLPLVMVALFLQTAYGGDLGVYWGQDSDEGTLSEACATRKYASINIAFLNQFGHGRKPEFNLTAGHCGPSSSGCQAAIRECQSKGVKVFLSNGATDGNYSLASKDDAKNMADYLWNSYLGGKSSSRPLREAVLDGIDFTLEAGAPTDFYSDLAGFLSGYSTQGNKLYGTGLFDYVWIRFYGSFTCSFFPGYQNALLGARDKGAAFIKARKILLRLPVKMQPKTGTSRPNELMNLILPPIKRSSKYRGVVLWSKYFDDKNGCSNAINAAV